MLVGGSDNISNDGITLGTCFSMFVYIRARFRFALSCRNMTAQSTGSHRRWRWNINYRDVVASSPFFFRPATRSSWRSCSQANYDINGNSFSLFIQVQSVPFFKFQVNKGTILAELLFPKLVSFLKSQMNEK